MTKADDQDRSFQDEALPHMAAVLRFALRLTQEPDQAEDLVQETYLKAYQKWDQYARGTRAKSWLFTICRNVYLRADERTKRHEEIVAAEVIDGTDSMTGEGTVFAAVGERDPEGTFWSRMIDEEIMRAIDGLPAEYRDAVVLSDLEELSYDEISTVLDVPVGTVKSRLSRGRHALQEDLYEYAVQSGVIAPRAQPEWSTGTEREGDET
ncbi:MAG: sigma-70 family RNA polymerase sigma factor [Gemmatimonadota bacterium]